MSSQKRRVDDGFTTIETLKVLVEEFVRAREWAQFHSPKNLAMAIGVEAGELMDLFRWLTEAESRKVMKNSATKKATEEELADVIICALAFANRTRIDIAEAVRRKVLKNSRKYPVKKYHGKF